MSVEGRGEDEGPSEVVFESRKSRLRLWQELVLVSGELDRQN